MDQSTEADLKPTPLHAQHLARGGRLVGFAGYALPVQFAGILAEHNHTRSAASLFDVSHMGQMRVEGPDFPAIAAALETVIPGDLLGLRPGEMRYSVLLNEAGGIEDDLIVTRPAGGEGHVLIVVNASRKHHDLAFLQATLGGQLRLALEDDRALLALQGPRAAEALAQLAPEAGRLTFMQAVETSLAGLPVRLSRSGYTGEDGFEISIGAGDATAIAEMLLAIPGVAPAGLGARDSLRLEAGLCLYGHDMDEQTDPVTAGLVFAIGKRRRSEGGFLGAEPILRRLAEGPASRRVGIRFDGRQPVREGAELVDGEGRTIGRVTSGTFSPTLQVPIAMGYLEAPHAAAGAPVTALVRGKPVTGSLVPMPFVPHRYVRSLS